MSGLLHDVVRWLKKKPLSDRSESGIREVEKPQVWAQKGAGSSAPGRVSLLGLESNGQRHAGHHGTEGCDQHF